MEKKYFLLSNVAGFPLNYAPQVGSYSLRELLGRNHDFNSNTVCHVECKKRNPRCVGERIYYVVARYTEFKEFKEFLRDARMIVNQNFLKDSISDAIKSPDIRVLEHLCESVGEINAAKMYINQARNFGNLKAVAYFFHIIKHGKRNEKVESTNGYIFSPTIELGKDITPYLKEVLCKDVKPDDIDARVLEMFIDENMFEEENIYIVAARCSPIGTITFFFDELCGLLGKDNTLHEISKSRSKDGEDVLTILTSRYLKGKGLKSRDLIEIYTRHRMYPVHYSQITQRSALICAVENKQMDFVLTLLEDIDTKKCNSVDRKGFRTAMEELKHNLNVISLAKQDERKSWAKALSYPLGGDQKGRGTKLYPNGYKRRCKRNFSKNKTPQHLRHIATMLYDFWKHHLGCNELQEVQVMMMMGDGPVEYFIAFNPMTRKIMDKLEVYDNWIRGVNDNCLENVKVKNYRTFRRTFRHIEKLRTFELTFSDVFNPLNIVWGNYRRKLERLESNILKFNVLFLGNHSDKERHAEEFLCDVAEEIRKQNSRKTYTFYIYGKKRPCMSCSGRMEEADIDYYNPNPGYLWLHGIKYQSQNAARNTLRLLLTTPPHVTFEDDQQMSDYDTGSDSEIDDN